MKGVQQSSTSAKEFHDMKVSKSYANAVAGMANMEMLWCSLIHIESQKHLC